MVALYPEITMETYTEQYFAKCGKCEEIGVRIENRNPANKTRFAKPELTVKTYSEESTCPEYIVNGLDGIYRREVAAVYLSNSTHDFSDREGWS